MSGREVSNGAGGKVKLGTIVPIPGSTTEERVRENSKLVDLTEEEMTEVDRILEDCPIKGMRYPEQGMKHAEG